MVEQVTFMNMCRITDDQGRWLIQERNDKNYPGVIFPGGHVEPGESFSDSIIREIREETGLNIEKPRLHAIKHWSEDGMHWVILMYTADRFSGELRSSGEGRVLWATREEVAKMQQVPDLKETIDAYDDPTCSELYYLFRQRAKLLVNACGQICR